MRLKFWIGISVQSGVSFAPPDVMKLAIPHSLFWKVLHRAQEHIKSYVYTAFCRQTQA